MDSPQRVATLAEHLLDFAAVQRPPAPLMLIHCVGDVRLLYTDWRYNQGYIYQLGRTFYIAVNSNDPEGEQRYTIFHEFFHVIERLQPTFHQTAAADWHAELLADHFASCILLSDRWFPACARACNGDIDALATECGATPEAVRRKLADGDYWRLSGSF